MELQELIRARKSIRSYEPREVEEEKLQKVLEAGRLAPSARNRQEWKFVAVKNPGLRGAMKEACCNQKMVAEAPVDLVICATQCGRMNCGQDAGTVDCSIALSFMMLQAAELGLGTCWLGAFDADKVSKVLSLPEEWTPVAVTPLGYPAEAPAARLRKKSDEVILVLE